MGQPDNCPDRPPAFGQRGPWHHVRFRVNTFKESEWPYQEPASLKDLSLGEEQSTSIVTALAWSAPGLATHGRCVLAVSTSNLLVSLWESSTNPADPRSWQRSCILNHAIPEHWLKVHGEELLSIRQSRIRAVTWSCEPPKVNNSWKRLHLLALINQNGDLYVLRLNRTIVPRKCVAQVLWFLPAKEFTTPPKVHFDIKQQASNSKRRKKNAAIRKAQRKRVYLSYTLAWSEWCHHGSNILRSILIYRHAGLEVQQQVACSTPHVTRQGNGIRYGELQLVDDGRKSVQLTVADGPSLLLPMVRIQDILFITVF